MQLILSAVDDALATAWNTWCGELDFVRVHYGSILDVACDAVVSPANSFGFMDGGIDAVYLNHFGAELQLLVRRHILQHYAGELLVGQADAVETNDARIPFLIVAPTMRVPMVLHDSVNPYLAARAVFLLLRDGVFRDGPHQGKPIRDHITSVALPGLGTGVGRVGPNTCARQVRQAIDDVLLGTYTMPQSWAEASERHQLLYTDRPTRLQY
ncbi:MAG: macro domain-containing protein [Chloroflexaceae bacterium]|jgi:O-acetyl-ADP-ribose deacetylase (regulator of RNase III)|nr:macro domain-containing protein [Chloroflexaceae bacterium]